MSYERIRVIILGCGSSGGVPRPAIGWGACDPKVPENHRLRCSILIQKQGPSTQATHVLVDTSPDLRQQLLRNNISYIDAICYTHTHADHTHGIDDIRSVAAHTKKIIPAYMDDATAEEMHQKFGYIFRPDSKGQYIRLLESRRLTPGEMCTLTGEGGEVQVLPFEVQHGPRTCLGFRFNHIAYTPDVNGLSEEACEILQNLDLWIVDGFSLKSSGAHFSITEALEWIKKLRVKRAILTNLHIDIDYHKISASLPSNVQLAFDGMSLET